MIGIQLLEDPTLGHHTQRRGFQQDQQRAIIPSIYLRSLLLDPPMWLLLTQLDKKVKVTQKVRLVNNLIL